MRDRAALARRAAPALLLLLLAAAWLAPSIGRFDLGAGEADAPAAWDAALDALPATPLVLVAFDPDLGTYAEIRPTVRTALADLLAREARLVFVSLTPEGRALALAENDRFDDGGANPERRADLGFVPGAEAGIVEIARALPVPPDAPPGIARRLDEGGATAFDALFVVGGNDIGPRSWIEQFVPRVGPLPVVAVAPTVLLPELLPYVESGQVAAVIGTPVDGAAYRREAWLGRLDRFADSAEPRPLPIAVGLLVALGVLAWGIAGDRLPKRRRERSEAAR